MFLANKLNKGGSLSSLDAQFNYVTMLLHGDGTNGAQNNTFLDSSTNNFTITRNGNTTQGSFSPYGDNWSNYLSTTATRFDTTTSTAFALSTSDFCYEGWIFALNPSAVDYPRAFGLGPYYNDIKSFGICIADSDYSDYITVYFNDGSLGRKLISSTTLPANQWNHIAVCRSGSNYGLYLNGTRIATYSSSNAISDGNATYAYIGSTNNGSEGFVGYASNVRLVKGSSVYDPTASTLTIPTSPLTAITNTSLLTCQSNRFIDKSSNAFSVVPFNSPSVQRFNPFGASTAYSTSVIGGSGYFDGSGDYLDTPSSSQLTFGTNDFTIEFWIATTNTNFNIMNPASATGSGYWGLLFQSGNLRWNDAYNTTNLFAISASAILDGAWHHVAICRSSGSTRVFYDGVLQTTQSDSTNYSGVASWRIGYGNVAYFNGYLSDFRVANNAAFYTSAFTPPTAPLTAISQTSLLLNYTNGAIFDNAMMNDLETVGNAQISTSVVKYGTGSIWLNGQGNEVNSIVPQPNISFGTGDFTIECWMYTGSTSGQNMLWSFDWNTGVGGWAFFLETYLGTGLVFHDGTIANKRSWTWSTNTWYHLAVSRSGTSLRLFVDGTQLGSTFTNSNNVSALGNFVKIGSNNETNTVGFTGYIDDLRITKGYARYTTTFTPPTKALSDTGP